MENIKYLCGYTVGKTALQAGKIDKNINNKSVKYTVDGKTVITNYATFIMWRIFHDNYTPDTITETHGYRYVYRFGRREREWGELDKVKTTYILRNPDDHAYYEINKSQWVFAKWLSENFATFDEAVNADKIIKEKAEAEAAEAERMEHEAEEREERECIERDNFKRECIEIAKQYIDTSLHETAVAMGKRYNKELASRSEDDVRGICSNFLLVYVYADKIENPLARQALIEWLHTGNKASPKCFEAWTGLKLPNTNSGRREFFENLKRTDFELVQI